MGEDEVLVNDYVLSDVPLRLNAVNFRINFQKN